MGMFSEIFQAMQRVTNHRHRDGESDPEFISHPRWQQSDCGRCKGRATLQDKASISRGTPAQLLADHTASVPVEVRAAIGQRDSVKRSVRREKAKAFPAKPF